jgi:hypothetical protein
MLGGVNQVLGGEGGPLMDTSHDARPVVGIDLHRRRTVLVSRQADGTQVGKAVRIENSPARLKATFG